MGTETGSSRIASLDQFRGYTVAGMFFLNFVGGYLLAPAIFKHHKVYCSYADTIMPQFFFAVGFAFRLTFLRNVQRLGRWKASKKAIMRSLGLILVGLVIYHLDGGGLSWKQLSELGITGFFSTAFRRSIFQALVHIGLTCMWILPVIGARPSIRILFLCVSGAAHLLLSQMFYFEWARATNVIDGGQLGFMTWTIPTLVGSLAYDVFLARGPKGSIKPLGVWSVVLMTAGYGISCLTAIKHSLAIGVSSISGYLMEPPFVPPGRPIDVWTMSQQTGSISYLAFAAGFSLAVYVICIILSDIKGIEIGIFRTLGQNALAGYIIHGSVEDAVSEFVPKDAPLWYVGAGFLVFFWITWLMLRYLEKKQIHLRL